MIRLTFVCDGATGLDRLRECNAEKVFRIDKYVAILFMYAADAVKIRGWTFRQTNKRLIVRCPKCETLRVARNAARAQRDKLREARAR